VRVIYESKWWIEVEDGEYRHYGCRSGSSRCGEQHGWNGCGMGWSASRR
jgi:hypothetical protein